jgi:hypothetical protein
MFNSFQNGLPCSRAINVNYCTVEIHFICDIMPLVLQAITKQRLPESTIPKAPYVVSGGGNAGDRRLRVRSYSAPLQQVAELQESVSPSTAFSQSARNEKNVITSHAGASDPCQRGELNLGTCIRPFIHFYIRYFLANTAMKNLIPITTV